MNMTIACPHCDVQLTVPDHAGGRAARCPKCRAKFCVPGFEALLDETMAAWLFTPETDNIADADPVAAKHRPAAKAPTATATGLPTSPHPPVPKEATEDATPSPAPPARPANRVSSDSVPSRPTDDPGPARLQVASVSAAGVLFDFPSRLLQREPFRASMPWECIQCGHDDPARLLARPLGFYDRSRGAFATSGEIEARFEMHVEAGMSQDQAVGAMMIMTELPSPFDHPTPYFVCLRCASKVTVTCRTITGHEGPECQVQIPSGPYALAWLGRVNGICGGDYAALEQRIHGNETGDWEAVPHAIRQRLANWCVFEPCESFVTYFPDSDFSLHDAGLAGVVLTNRRVVFCKHHSRGSLALDAPGELTLRKKGQFYDLHHRHKLECRRLGRLRLKHGAELMETLASLGSPLRVKHAVAS